jgi:hypothetical protein
MPNLRSYLVVLCLAVQAGSFALHASSPGDYFIIEVVDGQTGRGVPLVELRTVNKATWWTDSNGIIAWNEPGLMDLEVFFHISSPGYEYPKDGFGNAGIKLEPKIGASTRIQLKRLNIAERLYRITGQGIYRDSALVGRHVPLEHPVLNGQVMGQDTVIATPYRDKIYWFWGDTDRPSYPLGNFGASGATSRLPGRGGLDPSVGVDLTYFVDSTGFSKAVCPLPKGGMHWIESLLTVPDAHGVERLLARVGIMPGLGNATEWDLMIFDDAKEEFEPICRWEIHDPHQSAHPFRARVEGTNYYYIFPDFRVPADLASLSNLNQYEAFSCLGGDGRWQGDKSKVARDKAGRIQYTWRKGADRLHGGRINELIKTGRVQREENWARLLDIETGASLTRGLESVAWNEFRHRWIAFFANRPGEVWFAEADTPLGPWGYGRRVVTHGNYNFYNIAHHRFFNQNDDRTVYFEGTYTSSFSDACAQTPRYDYNQLMYRLSLDDPRLTLPVALYRVRAAERSPRLCLREQVEAAAAWSQLDGVVCFVVPPDRGSTNLIPVFAKDESGTALTLTRPTDTALPLFFGLPLSEIEPGSTLAGSWQCRARTPEEDELQFPLRLSVQGETVRVEESDSDTSGFGTFRDGKLILTLKTDEGTYILDGELSQRTLAGTWRQKDGTSKGTWSAAAVDTTPAERRSPALTVLKEYRRISDDSSYYSTEVQAPPGHQPGDRALCKVWKALSQIVLPGQAVVPR